MAKVYLKGGPCTGKTVTLTQAAADTGELVCRDSLYKNPETGAHHNGNIVFDFSGAAPGQPGKVKATHAHGGWKDVRHSVNHTMPGALKKSNRHLHAALRSLSRARKVRL